MLNEVEQVISDLKQGKMVIIVDNEDRENEGDLIIPADCVTIADVNFMITHAKGLLCLTLTQEKCSILNLELMAKHNKSKFSTNFTISVEAATNIGTGISARDRWHTIKTITAPTATPNDYVSPGHMFPLIAHPEGVLGRNGHTEAGCDLAKMAGFSPAAVIIEVLNEQGDSAKRSELEIFSKKHNLKITSIDKIINYRKQTQNLL